MQSSVAGTESRFGIAAQGNFVSRFRNPTTIKQAPRLVGNRPPKIRSSHLRETCRRTNQLFLTSPNQLFRDSRHANRPQKLQRPCNQSRADELARFQTPFDEDGSLKPVSAHLFFRASIFCHQANIRRRGKDVAKSYNYREWLAFERWLDCLASKVVLLVGRIRRQECSMRTETPAVLQRP